MIKTKAITNMLDAVDNAAETYLANGTINTSAQYAVFIKYLLAVAMRYNQENAVMDSGLVKIVIEKEYKMLPQKE